MIPDAIPVLIGNSGLWIGTTDGAVGQVWLNGKWIKNVSEDIDTGESYPTVAEWIYLTVSNASKSAGIK
jgi:hypothetical protein